jgi:hypothetical protein
MNPNEITAQIVDAGSCQATSHSLGSGRDPSRFCPDFGLERIKEGITRIVNGLPE